MLVQGFYFIAGLVLLYFGADFTLESAERIGKSWRMSPLLIGLFIVGFGTSLPEFFVSQLAGLHGKYEMSLGNVLGSNVANIFLVLGVSALISSLKTGSKALAPQFNFHFLATVVCAFFIYMREISWVSLGVFAGVFASYFFMNFKGHKEVEDDQESLNIRTREYLLLIIGFLMLYAGGEVLIYSGSNLGKSFGVSDFTISAILVAFGTSFPELVTSLIACRRQKDTDLIIGNIIGSNIFNLCFVLGSVGIYNFKIAENYIFEVSILLVTSVFFIVSNKLKLSLNKIVGVLFLIVYVGVSYYWVNYS